MKYPDFRFTREPVYIKDSFVGYVDSLEPFQDHHASIAVFDDTGKLCFQNSACQYLFAHGRASLQSLYTPEQLHDSPELYTHIQNCLATRQPLVAACTVYFDRNIKLDIHFILRPVLTQAQQCVGCVVSVGEESVVFEKLHLSRLQESVLEYRRQLTRVIAEKVKTDYFVRALLESTPFPVMLLNSKRQVIQINSACERMFGLSSRQATAESCEQFFYCYQKHNACPILDNKQEIALEESACLADNSDTHILRSVSILDDKDETLILEAFVDITDRYRAEQELKQLHEHNRLLLESTSEGIFGVNLDMQFTFANNAAANMLDYTPQELLGQDVAALIHHSSEDGQPLPREQLVIYKTIQHGKKYEADTIFWAHDNHTIPVHYSSSPVFENEKLTGAVIVFRNVAEARALHKKMEYMATHDSLTGLVNRNEFERQVKDQISVCRDAHQTAALCYVDLDQFKIVNDTCGHAAGDALLRQLTNVLHNNMREHDTLARLGGDEFGILYRDCDQDMALTLSGEVCRIIEGFRFIWEGKSFSVKASAGIALIDEHVEDDARLMSAADSACYIAKERGRNTIHLYQANDAAITKRKSEMIWVTRLNEALSHNQFQLYFQPIIQRDDDNCRRFIEILVRLHQPAYSVDDNVTLPGAFIPAAERYNLMTNIDLWVTGHVIDWLVNSPGLRHGLELCSINLSGQTIGHSQFAEFIKTQLHGHPEIASNICFEITETSAVADLKRAIEFINFIKGFGCKFALDDFGSGMSSFSYLKNLPVDFLKIDGTFIRDMVVDRVDYAMVEAINQVGQVMGIQTVAEFVENEQIVAMLQRIGVDYMQGHILGKPKPIHEYFAQLPVNIAMRMKN